MVFRKQQESTASMAGLGVRHNSEKSLQEIAQHVKNCT